MKTSGSLLVAFLLLVKIKWAFIQGHNSLLSTTRSHSSNHRMKGMNLNNSNDLLKELENFTRPSARTNLSAGDLDLTVTILSTLVNNNKSLLSNNSQQKFLGIASNILGPQNKNSWNRIKTNQTKDQKTSWTRLVVAIDKYGLLLASSMNRSQSRKFYTKNIIMKINKVGPNDEVTRNGLKFENEGSSIFLPSDVFSHCKNECRVVSVIYKTMNDFMQLRKEDKQTQQSADLDTLIPSNTTIVSSTVRPEPTKNFSNNVKIVMQNKGVLEADQTPTCVFWKDGLANIWKTDGCSLVPSESNNNVTTCECDHLTVFTALMDPYGNKIPAEHHEALGYITTIGCAVSLFAILLTFIVTLVFWKNLKSPQTIVMMNICIAIAVVCILVIAEGTARDTKVGCTVMAVLLHYFLLAVFCWMLCEGILLYLLVVKVMGANAEEKVKIFFALGWGLPALIVGTSLGITRTNGYGYYGYQNVCWLTMDGGLIWAFVAPAVFILLVNLVVLVLVLRQMMGTRHVQSKSHDVKVRMGVKATAVLLPLLGITWLFGLLAFNSATLFFKYIFAILNSLQGLMIFIFHCLLSKQVNDAVRHRYPRFSSGYLSSFYSSKPTGRSYIK